MSSPVCVGTSLFISPVRSIKPILRRNQRFQRDVFGAGGALRDFGLPCTYEVGLIVSSVFTLFIYFLYRPQQKVEAITRACGILFGIRYAAFTLYKSNPGTLESYTAVQLRTSEALPFLLNQLDALSSKQNQSSILALPPYITALHAIESILCEYPDGCSESYVAWEDPRIILVFGILMYNSASLEWQTALQTLDVVAHSVRCTQAMLRHLRTVRDNTAKGTYSKIRTVVLISWKHMLMNARSRNDKAIIAQTIAGGVVFCLEQLSVSTDTEDSGEFQNDVLSTNEILHVYRTYYWARDNDGHGRWVGFPPDASSSAISRATPPQPISGKLHHLETVDVDLGWPCRVS